MTALLRRDWQKLERWSQPVVELRRLLLQIEDSKKRAKGLSALDRWGRELLEQQETATLQDSRWSSARRDFGYAMMAVRARSREERREIDVASFEAQAKREPTPLKWDAPDYVNTLRALSYPVELNAAIAEAIKRAANDLRLHCLAEHRMAQRIAILEEAFAALEERFLYIFPGESLRPVDD